MSADRRFKNLVRARMIVSEENYVTARRRILQSAISNRDNASSEVLAYLQAHPEIISEMMRMMPRRSRVEKL